MYTTNSSPLHGPMQDRLINNCASLNLLCNYVRVKQLWSQGTAMANKVRGLVAWHTGLHIVHWYRLIPKLLVHGALLTIAAYLRGV